MIDKCNSVQFGRSVGRSVRVFTWEWAWLMRVRMADNDGWPAWRAICMNRWIDWTIWIIILLVHVIAANQSLTQSDWHCFNQASWLLGECLPVWLFDCPPFGHSFIHSFGYSFIMFTGSVAAAVIMSAGDECWARPNQHIKHIDRRATVIVDGPIDHIHSWLYNNWKYSGRSSIPFGRGFNRNHESMICFLFSTFPLVVVMVDGKGKQTEVIDCRALSTIEIRHDLTARSLWSTLPDHSRTRIWIKCLICSLCLRLLSCSLACSLGSLGNMLRSVPSAGD